MSQDMIHCMTTYRLDKLVITLKSPPILTLSLDRQDSINITRFLCAPLV
jgi:hypothetical protein